MYRAQDNNIGYYHQVLAEASATWLGNHMTPNRMSASLRPLHTASFYRRHPLEGIAELSGKTDFTRVVISCLS